MYTFNYHVPKNVNEAITIFKDSEEFSANSVGHILLWDWLDEIGWMRLD